MEINQIYNTDFLTNSLPDKCANLIIADPPYYKVKGKFDFVWNTFDDYLKDVEKWCIECKRLLADNGTLFWYGSAKNIAYAQIIFDKHFKLLSNITCHIHDRQTNKITTEDARAFINTSERILMYSNEIEPKKELFKPIMNYIKNERLKCKWNYNEMDKFLNIKASSCFWDKETSHEYVIPTKEHWTKLQKTGFFSKEYEDLRKEYEDLRKEYEDLRRPFNPIEEYKMDVLKFSQEANITSKYAHDTVKPTKLTRMLIQTCSRENDLVVVPFVGSGTECAMSVIEKRNFVGFEIEKDYCEMANDRIQKAKQQLRLF